MPHRNISNLRVFDGNAATPTDMVLVLTTAPADARAEEIARTLVEEHLAACVNVGPPMTSLYRWHGQVERDQECQLVIKTTRDRIGALEERVKALHPYELAEFVVLAVSEGSGLYLDWVTSETREPLGPVGSVGPVGDDGRIR